MDWSFHRLVWSRARDGRAGPQSHICHLFGSNVRMFEVLLFSCWIIKVILSMFVVCKVHNIICKVRKVRMLLKVHVVTSDCSCSRVQRRLALPAARGRARRGRAPSAQHPHAQGVVLPHGRDASRAAPSQALSVLPLSRQGAGAVKHRIQSIPEHERCLARRCSEFGLLYFKVCTYVFSW